MSADKNVLGKLENTAMLNVLNHLKSSFDTMTNSLPGYSKVINPSNLAQFRTKYYDEIEPNIYNLINAGSLDNDYGGIFLMWVAELENTLQMPARNVLPEYLSWVITQAKIAYKFVYMSSIAQEKQIMMAALAKTAGLVNVLTTQTLVGPQSEKHAEKKDELT